MPNDPIQSRLQNLKQNNFTISDDTSRLVQPIVALARRTRFEITKFGFSETFFVFGKFDSVTTDTLRNFSANAFALAKQSKSIPLPCGLFESVWCFAVAVADRVDSDAANRVRSEAPTKHWAAAEIPVILNSADGSLVYFEKTPLWGAAYYAGFRSQIKKYLAA